MGRGRCPRRRPRGPAGGPGRAVDSRAGSARRSRPRGGRCRARWRWPRARADRTGCPARRRSSVTPSLSSSWRSLRSMTLTPSNQGSAAIESGRASMARSKSSARASTLRMRSSAARPRSRWRSSAVRRLKFRNSARSRCRALRYSSAWTREASAWPLSASISASSRVGLMSISSARSWARVRWLGIEVIHQFVHEARHEADRADGLGVAHPGRARGPRPRRSPGRAARTGPAPGTRRASRRAGSPRR